MLCSPKSRSFQICLLGENSVVDEKKWCHTCKRFLQRMCNNRGHCENIKE